ncbi:MAG: T9SS type A sorting domain-containing protein [Chitinophagaceae bacterium]|jgi:uncharacterized delta-60 repeat protein
MKAKILFTAFMGLCLQSVSAQFHDGVDWKFGGGGFARVVFPPAPLFQAFTNGVIQTDRKIIGVSDRNIARLDSNGTIDLTFGAKGYFADTLYHADGSILNKSAGDITFSGIEGLADGKILISGFARTDGPLLLFRLLPDGHLDKSFGKAGIICNDTFGMVRGLAAAVQADNKIVVLGMSYDSLQVLVRYYADGSIDSSFGTNGKVLNSLVSMSRKTDLELLPDGRMLALGKNFNVARYMPDGSTDTSFNHSGIGFVIPDTAATFSRAMAVAADGKIWIGGSNEFRTPGPFTVGRLNTNGTADSSLDSDGIINYPWKVGGDNKCSDILPLPDGKILLGGSTGNPFDGTDNFALLRVKADGTIDSSFGEYGRLITSVNFSGEMTAFIEKLLLQQDGKILAFGFSAISSESYGTIGRYYANGDLIDVSIDELLSSNNKISVYPNPANSKVYYNLPGNMQAAQLSLLNMQGQMMLHTNQPKQNEIETGNLPNGCYILRIRSGTAVFTQKLVIFH